MNNLPFKELTISDLGNRETVRENTQRGEEIVKIPLDKIVIRDGFNVRQDYGHIESLAYSILENGQTVAGRVDVLADGTFMLTDGHRRYKALQILAEMGNEPFFLAIVNKAKMTEEQRILQMFTTQDNKPLAPHEIAELIQRLINLGYNQTSVAKKIGKTPAYISQMLSYANESPVIKDEVTKGNINVSTVLQLQKEIPIQSERVEAVKKSVAAKKESGKTTTVSVKDVTGKNKIDTSTKLAKEIADLYNITEDITQMINLIKNYI